MVCFLHNAFFWLWFGLVLYACFWLGGVLFCSLPFLFYIRISSDLCLSAHRRGDGMRIRSSMCVGGLVHEGDRSGYFLWIPLSWLSLSLLSLATPLPPEMDVLQVAASLLEEQDGEMGWGGGWGGGESQQRSRTHPFTPPYINFQLIPPCHFGFISFSSH